MTYITDIPILKEALKSLKEKEIRDKVNTRLNYLVNYSCGWDDENWDGLYFKIYRYYTLDNLPISDQLIFLMVILGYDENGEPLLPPFKKRYCIYDNTYANSILYTQLFEDMFNGVEFYQLLENLANVDLPNETY